MRYAGRYMKSTFSFWFKRFFVLLLGLLLFSQSKVLLVLFFLVSNSLTTSFSCSGIGTGALASDRKT